MTNFPTAAELDQGVAIYEAEMALRWAHPLPPEPRDQDVRERPPASVFCQSCGRVFDHYRTQGMRVLQLRKHQARVHPEIEMVETD
jgi:hypothetical protein